MRIVISAGPTREYLDSVRFISNPSSGKMGYALAREAARRGHAVTLVSGPVSLPPPAGVTFVAVTSAAEMARACRQAFRAADAAIMTAAVCDYRPVQREKRKLPKQTGRFALELEATEDIAASLGGAKGKRILVGFAMEDHDPYAKAERKLMQKRCDLIVMNGLDNIGADQAKVELYSPESGWSAPIVGSKAAVARRILRELEALAGSRGHAPAARQPLRRRRTS